MKQFAMYSCNYTNQHNRLQSTPKHTARYFKVYHFTRTSSLQLHYSIIVLHIYAVHGHMQLPYLWT